MSEQAITTPNLLQQAQARLREIAYAKRGIGFGTLISYNAEETIATVSTNSGIVNVELSIGAADKFFALKPFPGTKIEFGYYSPDTGFVIAAQELRDWAGSGKFFIADKQTIEMVKLRDLLDAIEVINNRLNSI
jgi:hypothetical protein